MTSMRWHLPLLLSLAIASAPAWAAGGNETLFNFVKPMAVVTVTTQNADLPSATAEATPEGEILRRVNFSPAPQPTLSLAPSSGSWDWSQADSMSLRIQNAMDWAITLEVEIEGVAGAPGLHASIALAPGPAQTLLIPLRATSAEDFGMRAGVPMPVTQDGQRLLLASKVTGELNRSKVGAVKLYLNAPKAAQDILLGRFGTFADGDQWHKAYTGIVDGFGQASRGDWPEKVKNAEQLASAWKAEGEQLKKWQPAAGRDAFGGLLDGPAFEGTGFFRTEKRNGRWWLVTPEGHSFWSLGVNAANADSSQTYVEGREYMFASLPKESDPLATFYGQSDDRAGVGAQQGRAFGNGRWYDFYAANRFRADGGLTGDAAAAAWRERTLQRLGAWGFNTLGDWSDPAFAAEPRLPYSVPLSISGDYASVSTGYDWWGAMPDPFDPRFAMAAERAIAIAARDHREDAWLLGYYADNELAWAGHGDDAQSHYALAFGALKLSTDSPAKRAFTKQLKDKYKDHEALAKAWGVPIAAWEDLDAPGYQAPQPSDAHPAISQDYSAFLRLYADQYFKTLKDSLQWHAPNHLLLGPRFAVSTPEALASCAQYCDLLSFNLYVPLPHQGYDVAYLSSLDKPVLITEFHFGSRDRGPFWGGVAEVYNEQQRGEAYQRFLAEAVKAPNVVGAHWFQYLDQPVTGRLLDGENGHIGLVGITDLPFTGFVDAVRKANQQALKAIDEQARAAAKVAPEPKSTPVNDSGAEEEQADSQ
ncbi:beta-galactosidase [Pseudomonas sp. SCB32]|uniref:beta-galactosidase n=1 Tax=Pseudomonas sp. SCB32 TaxID=2653853 RepID=UPI001264944D|nr:beta-galactosidase [Pseudomonas sp. SCB32]